MKYFLILFLTLSVSILPEKKSYDKVKLADAHLHLLDFLQNGDYLEDGKIVKKQSAMTLSYSEMGKRIEAALWAMDRANVSHALVSGMPFVKKWSENEEFRSAYYLDSSSRMTRARDTDYVVALSMLDYKKKNGQKGLDRLFACVSGFDGTDLGAVDMIAKRIKEFPGTFRCIGEVMSRHDDLTNLTLGERPRANHSALFRVYDFAAINGLPVSIHHNIAAVSPNGEAKKPAYLQEMLDAFNEFPKTQFIWCHSGISRRIVVKNLVGILTKILKKHHSHVSFDISWVVFEAYVLKDLKGWSRLIKRYPQNFLIGSDAVGHYDSYRKEMHKFEPLYDSIGDEKVIQKIAHDNLISMMPKKGLTLKKNYKYPERRYVKRDRPIRDFTRYCAQNKERCDKN